MKARPTIHHGSSPGDARISTRLRALLLLLVISAAIVLPHSAAQAVASIGVVAEFPTIATVGQTSLTAFVAVYNTSSGPEASSDVTLNSIHIVPSCSNFHLDVPVPATQELSRSALRAPATRAQLVEAGPSTCL